MAAQFANHLPRGGIPELANHVVRNARDDLPIRRRDDFANPLRVGIVRPNDGLFVGVPPRQFAIVPARNERLSGECHTRHVTAVRVQILRLELRRHQVGLAHFEVRRAEEDAIRTGYANHGKRDHGPRIFLDELQRFGIRSFHGGFVCIGLGFKLITQAQLSREAVSASVGLSDPESWFRRH